MKYEQIDKVLTELNIKGIRNARQIEVHNKGYIVVVFEDTENIEQICISLEIGGYGFKVSLLKKVIPTKTPEKLKSQLEKIVNVFKENVEKFYSTLEDELKKILNPIST